ncbi:hypothetical protein SAMN02745126_01777 [Enhydrobacter aerosaccus]|uniref:Uncharacterized protein n=1 Tax=Enhydrobacter aerosaccus TaxID=225324 RepID=A0A1T4LY68_9HYPH|nr:hypothetical protein SAMN02745126_01777 [Enhydrobacter aerosaccus]
MAGMILTVAGMILTMDDKGEALPFRIAHGNFPGRKSQFDLSKRIVPAGPTHERFDKGRRPSLEAERPMPRVRLA